jgi:hypothetical protein
VERFFYLAIEKEMAVKNIKEEILASCKSVKASFDFM